MKLSIITLVMLLIFAFGIIVLMNPIKYISFIYRNELIIFLTGIISIIFSAFMIYLFGKKLVDKDAIFSIDNNGLIDKVNILDYPFISWKNVTKIEECKINNVPHLKVYVNNPKYYINQKKDSKSGF